MKPDLERLLEVAAGHAMGTLGPALEPGYLQSSTATLGVLLLAAREESERAAARRVEENAAVRALFAEAAPAVADAALGARLREAVEGREGDLTLSALEAANASLRALLIELHAHVEELDTPQARRIDEAIWSELALSTERRRFSLGLF